ncbi:tetratricopeptide repeat protein [Nocardia sp. NPDC059240]|uniref:tetratricopeptide repeat protein n=1 Tax=Nocardia sp. NPDC059240 TaxID=3346786 RepID=UPI0036AB073D
MNPRIQRAVALLDIGRPEAALELLVEVLAAEPDNVDATAYAASAALRMKRYPRAAEFARATLRVSPDHQFALRVLALAANELGNHAEAETAARRAVTLGPDTAVNHLAAAVVLREISSDQALAAIDQAIMLDPNSSAAHQVRGSILLRRRRLGRLLPGPASESFRTALRLDPENAEAAHNLALHQLHSHHWLRATRGFLRAGAMDPGLADLVRHNVGVVLRMALVTLQFLAFAVSFALLVFGTATPASNDVGGTDVVTPAGRMIGMAGVLGVLAVFAWVYRALPRGQRRVVWSVLRSRTASLVQVALLLAMAVLIGVAVATGSALPAALALLLGVFAGIVQWWIRAYAARARR